MSLLSKLLFAACFISFITVAQATPVNVEQPADFSKKFVEAMNAGNINGLLSLL
ncbi:hypothetical protein [Aeromonas cavernicola]|uniref:hypothetical protein n=1 Tax=Aeromonas cavernicola TaxID=1006623 RepID=UPI0012FDD1CC|nr:hypothetical protein [Aeromonas cavernicola]